MRVESEESKFNRIDATVRFTREGVDVRQLANEYEVNPSTIYYWINRTTKDKLSEAIEYLKANGREDDAKLLLDTYLDSPNRPTKKQTNTTIKPKRIEAALRKANGDYYKDLAKEYKVSGVTIFNWINWTKDNLADVVEYLKANGRKDDANLLLKTYRDSLAMKQSIEIKGTSEDSRKTQKPVETSAHAEIPADDKTLVVAKTPAIANTPVNSRTSVNTEAYVVDTTTIGSTKTMVEGKRTRDENADSSPKNKQNRENGNKENGNKENEYVNRIITYIYFYNSESEFKEEFEQLCKDGKFSSFEEATIRLIICKKYVSNSKFKNKIINRIMSGANQLANQSDELDDESKKHSLTKEELKMLNSLRNASSTSYHDLLAKALKGHIDNEVLEFLKQKQIEEQKKIMIKATIQRDAMRALKNATEELRNSRAKEPQNGDNRADRRYYGSPRTSIEPLVYRVGIASGRKKALPSSANKDESATNVAGIDKNLIDYYSKQIDAVKAKVESQIPGIVLGMQNKGKIGQIYGAKKSIIAYDKIEILLSHLELCRDYLKRNKTDPIILQICRDYLDNKIIRFLTVYDSKPVEPAISKDAEIKPLEYYEYHIEAVKDEIRKTKQKFSNSTNGTDKKDADSKDADKKDENEKVTKMLLRWSEKTLFVDMDKYFEYLGDESLSPIIRQICRDYLDDIINRYLGLEVRSERREYAILRANKPKEYYEEKAELLKHKVLQSREAVIINKSDKEMLQSREAGTIDESYKKVLFGWMDQNILNRMQEYIDSLGNKKLDPTSRRKYEQFLDGTFGRYEFIRETNKKRHIDAPEDGEFGDYL